MNTLKEQSTQIKNKVMNKDKTKEITGDKKINLQFLLEDLREILLHFKDAPDWTGKYEDSYNELSNAIKIPHLNDKIDFAEKMGAALNESKSSTAYFFMQQAYGEDLEWNKIEKILNKVSTQQP